MPLREITIETPPGIGDIFWCWRKLAPHFDLINCCILVPGENRNMDRNHLARRAERWIPLFPKAGKVSFRYSLQGDHRRCTREHFCLSTLLKQYEEGRRTFLYGVNGPIERGTPLEELDDEICATNLRIKSEPCYTPNDYYIFYCSGYTNNHNNMKGPNGTWPVHKWLEFLDATHKKLGGTAVFMGATYDVGILKAFEEHALKSCIPFHTYRNEEPAKVIHVIKNAKFFIGYQSGLNVLADNEQVPQIELIFNKLRDIPYMWAIPEGRGSLYNGMNFDTPLEKILSFIPDEKKAKSN